MRTLHRVTGLLYVALAATPQFVVAADQPPQATVRNVPTTHFGVTVADPYRYFENLKDPQVAQWMKAQADYTRRVMHRIPGRPAILEAIQRYSDATAARILDVLQVGEKIYYEKMLAEENLPKLYVRDGFDGEERVLVDPDANLPSGVHHAALDYYAPSDDNRYLAYGISAGGSEDSVLHIIDVQTGKPTGDVIDRAQDAEPSWLPDGRLLYARLQALAPGAPATDKYMNQRTFVHVLGANPDTDVAVFGTGVVPGIEMTPTETGYVTHVAGSPFLIGVAFNGVAREMRIWSAPLSSLKGAATPWVRIADTADAVIDFAASADTIYLTTHKGAGRYRVVRTSLAHPDITKAETVVPETDAVITGIVAASDALYIRKMHRAGDSELARLAHGQSEATPIPLPFLGDLQNMTADPRQPGILFFLGGWTRFGQYYAYSVAGGITDTGLAPQGPYDSSADLVASNVDVRAGDGTLVPLSIVHRRDIELDGMRPTILYGYGAYGMSETPFYRPGFLPWFDRGGVLAVAHVRGGGEQGETWYKAGFQATKPNTWRDAIACGEWLISNRYTSSQQLAVMGGSAGGILVGRAITERPDLFGAAIDQVPASDLLRAEFSANGPPNIPEFGSVTTEAGFKALLQMSPYHAVTDGVKYPAVLLITGINDPRVDSWEAAKMAARLQAASSSDKPILLRVDYDAGHGMGSTKRQAYAERADIFTFLLWQAGLEEFQP